MCASTFNCPFLGVPVVSIFPVPAVCCTNLTRPRGMPVVYIDLVHHMPIVIIVHVLAVVSIFTMPGMPVVSVFTMPVPEFIDPRFRENKPKSLVFSH